MSFVRQLFPLWKKGIFPGIISFLSALVSLCLPIFPKIYIDEIINKNKNDLFVLTTIIFFITSIVYICLSYFRQFLFFKFQKENTLFIQQKLTNRVLFSEFEFFKRNHSGYLSQRIREDVEGVAQLFSSTTLFGIISIIQCLGALIIIFNLNWFLSLIAISPLPFIFWKIFNDKNILRRMSGELLERSANLTEVLTDTFGSIEITKSSGKEESSEKRINESLNKFQNFQIEQEKKESLFHFTIKGMIKIGEVLVWAVGIGLVLTGDITLGVIVAFSGYIFFLYEPIESVSMLILTIEYGRKSIERINQLWNIVPETGDVDPGELKELRLENVSFWYNEGKNVIKNLSLNVSKGDKLLIKGKSGSGKTTLTRLILGLYNRKKGDIYWNDKPLDSLDKKKLRKRIGYVSQDVYLFKENLLYNLTLGETIESDKIINTLNICGLSHLIENPSLNIKITERGFNLSGGERQRLALVRALLKNPDVIVLDEATANIDLKTKNEIDAIILNHFRNKIIIKISHHHTDENGWRVLEMS